MASAFQDSIAAAIERVETLLDHLLPTAAQPESRLYEAMRYACLNGGKRLRPFLVQSSAQLFGVDPQKTMRVSAAVELVHCYSLIHDDLPAMDDSDTRRGKPAAHKEFDEATAILAGDALQAMAFEVLASPTTHGDAQVRCELIACLARASGAHGMVGGQMLDLLSETRELNNAEITRLQQMKTGALFCFTCEAGAILGKASERSRHALRSYAHDLGLAFQMTDDILDATSNVIALGKPVGNDHDAGKATFVSIMGLDRAKAQAHLLSDQAITHLGHFGDEANTLRDLARYAVERGR